MANALVWRIIQANLSGLFAVWVSCEKYGAVYSESSFKIAEIFKFFGYGFTETSFFISNRLEEHNTHG